MKNLTIIGFGIMGQTFAKNLKEFFNITIWNRSDKSRIAKDIGVGFEKDFDKAIKEADIMLVCVPMSVFEDTVKKISPLARKDAIVADLCSVKEMPMEVMGKSLKCSFVGTHPLFGNVDNFKGMKIVVCKGKGDCNGLIEGLEKTGAKTVEMDALEHDMLIGEIQGVTHFIGLSVRDYMKKYDREKLKSVSTLSFEYLLGLLDRMEKNNPEIFMEIQKHNKYARESRKNLLEKLIEKDREMDRG